MKTRSQPFLFLSLLLSALLGAGCVGFGKPEPGQIDYHFGVLKSMETAPLDRVYSAAKTAIADFDYTVTVDEKTAVAAKLVAHGPGDEKLTVNMDWQGDELTFVKIKAGTFGAREFSTSLLKRMRKKY